VDLGLEGSLLSAWWRLRKRTPVGNLDLDSSHDQWRADVHAVFAAVGVLGGVLRDLAPEKEDVWRFSPFFDLSAVYRLLRQRPDLRRSLYQIACLAAVIFAELLRFAVARCSAPGRLWCSPWSRSGIVRAR